MTPDEVINHYSNKRGVTEALGVSRQVVDQWIRRGLVPMGRQFEIQILTGGGLRAGVNSTATEKENA